MDFTLNTYKLVLHSLQQQTFSFKPYNEFANISQAASLNQLTSTSQITSTNRTTSSDQVPFNSQGSSSGQVTTTSKVPSSSQVTPTAHVVSSNQISSSDQIISPTPERTVCLRHDVDLLPQNSLKFARIQNTLGICGTYYFRAVPESWDEDIIKEIHALGHDVGYHYESLTTMNGNFQKAISDFETNLEKLRKLVPVSTICMHGSPRSKHDSKDLWKHYNYRDYGIIAEPYFDTDFSLVAYYTDTGRMWNGNKYSVRDKVTVNRFPTYHSTSQMIEAIRSGTFPQQAMLTFHPQRWSNEPIPWLKELIWQKTKNMAKFFLIKLRE